MKIEEIIKNRAKEIGFSKCGIAKADHLIDAELRYKDMISNNYHAGKVYLEKNVEKRFNPELVLRECKSIIVCMYNYLIDEQHKSKYHFAKYSYIEDYHTLIKNKLLKLVDFIKRIEPVYECVISVDSGFLSEKSWAVEAGLGYIGKNTVLNSENGSFFLLGAILTQMPLETDKKNLLSCGDCNLCITFCPTKAIIAPYKLDSNKCISFQTIENKNSPNFENNTPFVFGCDICQDVCPNNKKSKISKDAINHKTLLVNLKDSDIESLTYEQFEDIFQKSAVNRTGYEKFMKEVDRVKSIQNCN